MTGRGYMLRLQSTEHETPQDLFDALDREFGPFDLDPCGCPQQHYSAWKIQQRGGTCYDGSTEALDGLVQPWHGKVFMNSPYGLALRKWVPRAVHQVECGNVELVLGLLPAKTETKVWQEYILKQVGPMPSVFYQVDAHPLVEVVRFLPGRLKFSKAKNSAPFPSAVVVWKRSA